MDRTSSKRHDIDWEKERLRQYQSYLECDIAGDAKALSDPIEHELSVAALKARRSLHQQLTMYTMLATPVPRRVKF